MAAPSTFTQFALRDVAIMLTALLAWSWFAPLTASPGPMGDFAGLLLGALLCLCAHLVHEWGHLLGGLAGEGLQ